MPNKQKLVSATTLFLIVLCSTVILASCSLYPVSRPSPSGAKYLLAIGMDYPQLANDEQLHYAKKDATDITDKFSSQGYDATMLVSTDTAHVTKAAIMQAIESCISSARHEDLAVIFIASHTRLVDAGYEILTEDGQGIGSKELLQALSQASCHVVLIMDCCHAGLFVPDDSHSHDTQYLSDGPGYAHPVSNSIDLAFASLLDTQKYSQYPRLWALTSAGYHEKSFEPDQTDPSTDAEGSPIANGFFTHYLLRGLEKSGQRYYRADENLDEIVLLSELFTYIKQSYAANPYTDQPLPRVSGTAFDIAIPW
ncbi:MAG: caspase family protein [Sphaerochaeta associata]|uniref:caspase family protein n=1 Tax=Sphaerochaeta associata TaxID=1129264 RepID=UPI002B1EF3D9|nr:caspase family protein [Sphaerochaeta associata]MEA5027941.1 caspase family protein [Sphaerochaeta associata]